MGLYWLLSPQARIARGKLEVAQAQKDLDAYDGDLAGAWPRIGRLLGVALRQVGRVGWPAVVASLPLLALLVWLSTAYGYTYPTSGQAPAIHVQPPRFSAQWKGSGQRPPRLVVADPQGRVVADVVLSAPVPVLHKRQWWNAFIGNPAGYLPSGAEVERVDVDLPRKEVLTVGPAWMHGWEFSFFLTLVVVSIALKLGLRIQ